MSKYGDFEVVRTAKLKCKRANDPNADGEGMRDYSYLKCPHCNIEVIELPTANVYKQKYSAIKDHLRVCETFKYKGGVVAPKRSTSTAMVVAPQKMSEVEKLRAEMVEMKRGIKKLEDKTSLYDSVLEAVMPSLALPLTAPEENAQITLRQAAIKDIKDMTPLALPAPMDAIPKEMHIAILEEKNAMIEQKDQMLATEKERREELKEAHVHALENYKKELEAKNSELSKTKRDKEQAEKEKNEVDLRAQEVTKTVLSLSTRTDQLQKERDVLNAKYHAMLKGHEQAVRSHGKHGSSQLSKMHQGQKRAMVTIDAQTAAAVAIEKEFAAKRARVA